MTKIRASVEIHVPVEKVSAFVDDWHNFEKWYVGIYDFKPTTEKTDGQRCEVLVQNETAWTGD